MGYFTTHARTCMPTLAAPLDDALTALSKVRLLRLFAATPEPVSGREAGRRIGMAKRTADVALRELLGRGLVLREDTRAESLYRINREHSLVATAILPLFTAEQQWTESLFETLRDLVSAAAATARAKVIWAGIFGSVARREEDANSDLDLAVITSTPAAAQALYRCISETALGFTNCFGLKLSPFVQPLAQLKRLAAAHDPLVTDIARDARRLLGDFDIADLLRD
jgi:predicted nucleotidyltransferase